MSGIPGNAICKKRYIIPENQNVSSQTLSLQFSEFAKRA